MCRANAWGTQRQAGTMRMDATGVRKAHRTSKMISADVGTAEVASSEMCTASEVAAANAAAAGKRCRRQRRAKESDDDKGRQLCLARHFSLRLS
jgi:hypothetical protein